MRAPADVLRRARAIQRMLAERVEIARLKAKPRIVGGVDLAYAGDRGVVAYVEVPYGGREPALEITEVYRVVIPYIPTYLFIREGPPILRLLYSHKIEADVLMVNGHGLTHPRRMGLATYIGVVTGIPTIGVAKKPLYGRLGAEVSAGINKIDVDGESLGLRIKTASGGYIYASIGNRVSLEDVMMIVLDNLGSHRLPTPLHHADKLSKAQAKEIRKRKHR